MAGDRNKIDPKRILYDRLEWITIANRTALVQMYNNMREERE